MGLWVYGLRFRVWASAFRIWCLGRLGYVHENEHPKPLNSQGPLSLNIKPLPTHLEITKSLNQSILEVPSLIDGLRVVQGLRVIPVFLYRYSMKD
jgi:hypothetical protein